MATNVNDEEIKSRILRITDIAQASTNPRIQSHGYEEMPLLPLEIAVEPLISRIPNIVDRAHAAIQRCERPPANGLSIDESASIILYTMCWTPENTCLYALLNDALRSEDIIKLEPWFLYLKLFHMALSRLPSTHLHVYRGVKKDLHNEYHRDGTITWLGFSSCTLSIHVLQSEIFLGTTEPRTMLSIECDSGKDIRRHSWFPREDEILLPAGTQFRIISCLKSAPGLYIIQLDEIKPPGPSSKPYPEIDGTYALDNGSIKLDIYGQDVHRSDVGSVGNTWFCGNTILLPKGRQRKRVPTALIKLPDGDILELSTAGSRKRWKRREPHDSQLNGIYQLESNTTTMTISGVYVSCSDCFFPINSELCGKTVFLPRHWNDECTPTALIKLPDENVLELSFAGYQRLWKK